jgi:hypothetical protein
MGGATMVRHRHDRVVVTGASSGIGRDARSVACALVDLARHPARELLIELKTRLLPLVKAIVPGAIERPVARKVETRHPRMRAAPIGHGNLFAPNQGWQTIDGGWRQDSRHRLARPMVLASLLLPALPVAAQFLRRPERRPA